jgi:hypothetical protein
MRRPAMVMPPPRRGGPRTIPETELPLPALPRQGEGFRRAG